MSFFTGGDVKLCPKRSKVVFGRCGYGWLRWLFPLSGLAALIWFLLRVIPKPSRAAYPCQRVAFPLASGFIVWLTGAVASVAAFRKAQSSIKRAKYVLAAICIVASVGFVWLSVSSTSREKALAVVRAAQPANSPIGTAIGVKPGRVAWIHDANATDWVYTNPEQAEHWYEHEHTDQAVVNGMVSRAIRSLAGANTDAEAWDAIFRNFNQRHGKGNVGYTAGEKIGIKINHTLSCGADPCVMDKNPPWGDYMNYIDNSPQLTIALLRQLTDIAGVAPGDISIGDPSRIMPNYWYDMVEPNCPGVVYFALYGGRGRTQVEFDTNAPFYWSTPDADGKVQDYVPTCFAQADYFINFPVLKSHLMGGITICGKNHYGSLVRTPVGDLRGKALDYYSMHLSLPESVWQTGSYRCLVDLLGHPQLGGKTLLFLVDAIFAGEGWDGVPSKWTIAPFNNDWPSSVFVSQDGVAMDSVGFDFLFAQWPKDPGANMSGSDDYLHEAALADNPPSGTFYDPDGDGNSLDSLGVHEHWNNDADRQYTRNLDPIFGGGIDLVRDTVVGDFDGDGDVDWSDFAAIAAAYGSEAGGGGWEAGCDISEPSDGAIDLLDVLVFCRNWLEGVAPILVEPGAELVEVYSSEGIYFEGPSWDPVTGKLYFSKRTDGYQILRLDSPGVAAVWMNSAPGTNGTYLGINGRLLTADEGTMQIRSHRIGAAGPEDSQVLGTAPKMPNDLCQLANGRIYFSCPDWGAGPNSQGVYRLDPNGSISLVKNGLYQPNGVVASNDGRRLYVAESSSSNNSNKRWWAYPINADGSLGTGIVFFQPTSPPSYNDPDGMTIDELGNLYFAGMGGVWIVSPAGELIEMIEIPQFVSNVDFGGADGRTLYITCQDKVCSLAMRVRGGMWVDNISPSPNPMQWSAPPDASGPYSIAMTAATAGDQFGVEYYFTNETVSGHDSGWQNSPYYEDTELQRDVVYTYRVKAKDKSELQNQTSYSSPASSTTEVNAPPVTVDAVSSAASSSAGSTLTWNHTIGSGQNRILVVGTQSQNPGGEKGDLPIYTIRYNGVGLLNAGHKLIESGGDALTVELWYSLDAQLPPAGTYPIEIMYLGSVETRTAGAISVANANQASPEDKKSSTSTSGTISTTVSCSPKAMVIDAVGCGNVGSFTPLTAGMTERYDIAATGNAGAGSTMLVESLGNVTIQWSSPGAGRMAQVAASFAPLP